MDKKYSLYNDIYERGINLCRKNDIPFSIEKMSFLMDVESADINFDIDLEKWLKTDDMHDFMHDFIGIITNCKRDTFPSSFNNFFIPRFAKSKEISSIEK